jgi:hypothetical protein
MKVKKSWKDSTCRWSKMKKAVIIKISGIQIFINCVAWNLHLIVLWCVGWYNNGIVAILSCFLVVWVPCLDLWSLGTVVFHFLLLMICSVCSTHFKYNACQVYWEKCFCIHIHIENYGLKMWILLCAFFSLFICLWTVQPKVGIIHWVPA